MKRTISMLLTLVLILALLAGCDTGAENGTPPTSTAPAATAAGGRIILEPAIDRELFGGSETYESLMAGIDSALAAGLYNNPIMSMAKSMTAGQRNGVGADMSAGAPTGGTANAPAESTHSTTNVQVAGVDEADIVKTDGQYLYYVANDRVYAVDATAAKPRVVHTWTFKRNVKEGNRTTHESPIEIYLDPVGKRLTILVQGTQYETIPRPTETKPEETKPQETKPEETRPEETKPEETKPEETRPGTTQTAAPNAATPPDAVASSDSPASDASPAKPGVGVASDMPMSVAGPRVGILPMNQRSYVVTRVYAIADPAKPSLLRTYSQEGSYLSSRLVDGTAFVLTNKYEYRFITMRPMTAAGVAVDDSIHARESASGTGSGTTISGSASSSAQSSDATGTKPTATVDPKQFKDTLPKVSSDPEQTTWETLPADRIGIVPQGDPSAQLIISAVPVANEALKPSTLSLLGASGIVYASRDSIYVANPVYEYQAKRPEDMRQSMKIYRLSIAGGRIAANGSGSVPGMAINQFAMDEHNGHFRIATTTSRFTRTETETRNTSESAVYVLDKSLKVVGEVGKLGPGETIRSVRFMGDRAYVVTFRTTDPLYVLDLKTPTAPKVLGELKIPGFSTYLHPYGENLLLGFGYDAVVEGSNAYQTGIKVSLFDISDLSQPKERSTLILGGQGSYSALDQSHKALLFSQEQNLIAFPATIGSMSRGSKADYRMIFQGLVVLSVNDGKLNLRGGLTNATSLTDIRGEGLPHEKLTPADRQALGGSDTISRAVMLNGRIVTLSARLIRQYGLDSLKLEGEAQLAGYEDLYGPFYGTREAMPAVMPAVQ